MSPEPAWGSRLLLMLATATIVIGNYQDQKDNSVFYEQHGHEHMTVHNASRLYGEMKTPKLPLRIPHLRHHRVSQRGPYFENVEGQEINSSQNMAHLGNTALLDCRVVMLSDRTVMWIRQSPERTFLLTMGKSTHTADPRYSVQFKYPNNWRLAISSVQKEDRGLYVCQVNTHPPRMLITNVTILAPDIRIMDDSNHELRDRYYKTGSGIELVCIARSSRPGSRVPHPSWKKNGVALPDHVSIRHNNGSDNELVTRLHIELAKKTDSGEYSCSIGQFSTIVVNIHVLNGEKQAAVHHDQWSVATTIGWNFKSVFLSSIIAFFFF